jgi:DNA-directed RNA polymerase specialized sigma24 family protein
VVTPQLTDKELIQLVLLKERAGAEALYDIYHRVLFLAIIRITPQKEKAEDVLEQVYIKAWNSIGLYSPQNGKLLAWLMAIARSLANDSLKEQSTSKQNGNQYWKKYQSA